MKKLITIAFLLVAFTSCQYIHPVKLKKGDKFYLTYGYSVQIFTVVGNNSNGYYCLGNWPGAETTFITSSDLTDESFKLLIK